MFDVVERSMIERLPEFASQRLVSGIIGKEEGFIQVRLLVKVISNYLQRPTPYASKELFNLLNANAVSNEDLQYQVTILFQHMINTGTVADCQVRRFTTGQIAPMFGVTVATINNWLKSGKITGAEKSGDKKHWKIPVTALYISASNEMISIEEIACMYEEDKRKTKIEHMSESAEQKELLDSIVFFEKKYEGEYEKTLGKRKEVEMTSLEKRDAREWQYLLECVHGKHE